jgi:hypothetical protein
MKNTLILGHGRNYTERDIWCSPIPVNEWISNDFVCVDNDIACCPDILFDLKHKEWDIFSNNIKFDIIIDTCGGVFSRNRNYSSFFLRNILNILSHDGTFYGNNFTASARYLKENLNLSS